MPYVGPRAARVDRLEAVTVLMYGEWWIDTRKHPPKQYKPPRHTVAGELSADGTSDWTLETIGSLTAGSIFEHVASRVVGSEDDLVTIRGADNSGKSFSLLGCFDLQSIWHSNSIREGVQRWHVSTIAQGEGIWVDSETMIDQVNLELRDLDAWAVDPRDPDIERDFEANQLTFSLSPRIEPAPAQGGRIERCHGRSWNVSTETVEANANAVFKIHDTLRLDEINEKWVRPLTEMVSFFAMRPSFPTSISARLVERFGQEHPIYVNLRLPQELDGVDLSTNGDGVVARQLEMLATRRTLREQGIGLDDLLAGWFALQTDDKLSAALVSLNDSQARRRGFKFDDSLLYACNSLELFHSSCFDGKVEEESRITAVVNRVRDGLSSRDRELLGERLATSRRKYFTEKVHEIARACGNVGDRLTTVFPTLATDINRLRNAVAHPTTRPRDVHEQIDVLIGAQWLARRALLQALRLPAATCDVIVLDNNAFGLQMQRLESWHSKR